MLPKKSLGLLGLFAVLTGGHNFDPEIRGQKRPSLKSKGPSNGAYQYWFRSDGSFLSTKQKERMKYEEIVFTCFAIKDENAAKKFNKFMYPGSQK